MGAQVLLQGGSQHGEVLDLETDMLPPEVLTGPNYKEVYARTGQTVDRDGITLHVYEYDPEI